MGADGWGCSHALGHSGLCKSLAEAIQAQRKGPAPRATALPPGLRQCRPPPQPVFSQVLCRLEPFSPFPSWARAGRGPRLLLPSPVQVLGSAKQVQDTEWPQKALQPPPPQGQHCHLGQCLQVLPTRPAEGESCHLLPWQPRTFSAEALAQRHPAEPAASCLTWEQPRRDYRKECTYRYVHTTVLYFCM